MDDETQFSKSLALSALPKTSRLHSAQFANHSHTQSTAAADPTVRSYTMADRDNDMVTVIVGSDETEFELQRQDLCDQSTYFKRLLQKSLQEDFPAPGDTPALLTRFQVRNNITLPAFYDFSLYLRTGRVLQFPHNGVKYAIDAAASKLIAAVRLGIIIQSPSYQDVALRELYQLGPSLEYPERFVNEIFASANMYEDPQRGWLTHPARWLIVTICAANTCTAGLRLTRLAHTGFDGVVPHARGDTIKALDFWEMYKEHCERMNGKCVYPPTYEQAIRLPTQMPTLEQRVEAIQNDRYKNGTRNLHAPWESGFETREEWYGEEGI